jgi:phosphomannomutase/phosphoglucomutase
MSLSTHIFRQYDIRGIVGEDLTNGLASEVGRAYGSAIRQRITDREPVIVVGYDNRPSSPDLQAGVVSGLRAAGVTAVTLGCVPTPVTYWAEQILGADGAIMVTGSHNPPEWNGIKMTVGGAAIYGDAIQDLLRRIQENDMEDGSGGWRSEEVIERYVQDVAGRFELARPVKVVVDCGNGSAALLAVELLEALGADVIPLYCESDGTFPNHHPDPTVDETLVEMIELVKEHSADLGVAFDGDADRIGVVDEKGQIIRGDMILLLFGLDLLARKGPGAPLVFDVKCSQALPEVYEAAGGKPIMWKTGHSLIKEKMKESGAPLAGELSGHICVADDYLGFDDALYDACRMIDLVSRSDRPLSALTADFPSYVSTPEIRIDVDEETKFTVVEAALEHFKGLYEVVDVDGARILFGDGWGLLRTSNTQPVIVARFEARSEERLREIRAEVEGWLETQGVHV